MVIRQIGVGSLAKMMGALYGLMGLIFGCILAVIALVGAGFIPESAEEPAWLGTLFGVGAVVFLPVFYGVLGFVFGALTAWLYNVVAGMVGGVTIETQ
jgi:ABC-type lipoprotein release transport system permease subunit